MPALCVYLCVYHGIVYHGIINNLCVEIIPLYCIIKVIDRLFMNVFLFISNVLEELLPTRSHAINKKIYLVYMYTCC